MKTCIYKGFPVYVIKGKKGIKTNKAILFLAGGGGMARPMFLHFDVVSKMARDTGATIYFAYYPLAPKHNVVQALEWLEDTFIDHASAICKQSEHKSLHAVDGVSESFDIKRKNHSYSYGRRGTGEKRVGTMWL